MDSMELIAHSLEAKEKEYQCLVVMRDAIREHQVRVTKASRVTRYA